MPTDCRLGPRLVFVGGAPRSGTTLFQDVLTSHSAVAGGPEFDFVNDISMLWSRMQSASVSGRTSYFYDVERLEAAFHNFLSTLLIEPQAGGSTQVISEKTPKNLLAFRRLARLIPDAYFILVVRDPRAVTASLNRVAERAREAGIQPPKIASSFSVIVNLLRRYADEGLCALDALGPRCIEVRYEDLLVDPLAALEPVCKRLGIDFEDSMVSPEQISHERATGTDIWLDSSTDGRSIDSARIHAWQHALSRHQVGIIEATFRDHGLYRSYFEDAETDWVYRAAAKGLRLPNVARRLVKRTRPRPA